MCGDTVLLQVVANGTAPLNYQWLYGGNPVANATGSSLTFNHATPAVNGGYSVALNNSYGALTSSVATVTVLPTPPTITSATSASGKEGVSFVYAITADHSPISFSAAHLPAGLTANQYGFIYGVPQESGKFASIMSAANSCTYTSVTLTLTITSSIPTITNPTNVVVGGEQTPLSVNITATENPTWYGGQDLPIGLYVNPANGVISGQPTFAGEFDSIVLASNVWGVGSLPVHFSITNIGVFGFSIDTNGFTTNYSSPYLLDFTFTLRNNSDPTLGAPLITDPANITVVAMEDGVTNSPTEMNTIFGRGSARLIKCFLVLDFTESVASLSNGNSYGDGISDAVHAMVNGAMDFVNQLPSDAQVGVYEFHRDDEAPNRVINLTSDKTAVRQAIAGIWTNYVQGFPAGSRCWDALMAAIPDLGPAAVDEQHLIVFVSDGQDESSSATSGSVIANAQNNKIRLFCIGFGAELNPVVLGTMATQTSGAYYDGTSGLTIPFNQIGKELAGQYFLRWATLKRRNPPFQPTFLLGYQGFVAWATNVVVSNAPMGTNPPTYTTNFLIPPYVASQHTGTVTLGVLRLVPDAIDKPKSVTLRATYVPRYVRKLRLHYQPNWPCTPSLLSTDPGEILYNWSLVQSNGNAGDTWLTLSSPNPTDTATSIPFSALGNLIKFSMRDMLDSSNAFSFFTVDNSIYVPPNYPTNGPSFNMDTNLNSFISSYPPLPHGTPIPWLIAHGYSAGQSAAYYTAAELADSDGDGALNWQEYRANTDPTNAASKFIIRSVILQPDGRHAVTFASASNRVYRVEASTAFPNNWQVVQDNIVGTSGDIYITDTRYLPGITAIFYRVLVY
jgi:hypothetical protein